MGAGDDPRSAIVASPRGVLGLAGFRRLWLAQTISAVGDQITRVALPLTAAVILEATAAQVALVYAAQAAPTLLFSLLIGVWVDRHERRPVLLATHVGRAILLATVPLAVVLHVLSLPQIFFVAFLVGTLEAIFLVAYLTYLPALVPRLHLVDANAKLQMSQSVAQIAGPGIGGVLVQLLTAGIAIVADAISYVVAAILIGTIRERESPRAPREAASVRREIAEGLAALVGHPVLRGMLVSATIGLFFFGALLSAQIVYLSREIGLDPVTIGGILGVGSLSALVGAALAGPLAARVGIGPSIVLANIVIVVGAVAFPASRDRGADAVPLLVAGQLALNLGATIYNVNGPSLRQALTPDRLLGRVNASYRFVAWGAFPLGAVAMSAAIGTVGLYGSLVLVVAGFCVSLLWVVASPLARVRQVEATSES